ncbi:MAG TPA: exonuclease domain-containing protein [Candidatus Paceibacterota bacterium]|nr:exonuclease domain-containing protein [Candidatus Paceibacterota bacterium]
MIALDVETTGLDPKTCSIVSLGAVDTDHPENQFYDECGVWEGAHLSDEALAIHGFTREELTNGSRKSEAELIRAFVAWACDRPENRTFVAQNVSFDHEFVLQACKRAGVEFPFAKRTLDIHSLVWMHMEYAGVPQPVGNKHSLISLDFALRYCGIPEEPKPHNALTGALSHAEVFARVAYTKKLLPDFSSFDIPWQTS